MPRIQRIMFFPPLAIGRLGGSSTPLESYSWVEDPTIHGAARNVIEPAVTLEVLRDGSVRPYLPDVIQFRDGRQLRPVAPFFELWARLEVTAHDHDVLGPVYTATTGRPFTGVKLGEVVELPLTVAIVERAGGSPAGVLYTVHVANRKAARRSGDEANAFEAHLSVRGDEFGPQPVLGFTPPTPGREPLVQPERPVPLGSFQVIRPLRRLVNGVDLGVLRVRYTPAPGEVYGPPSAVMGQDPSTGRFGEIVPPANRILNPAATWLQYDGDYSKYSNPEPSDTYDGADEGVGRSWGVVDDTCDGLIGAQVIVAGVRFTASSRISVGPPDYAPDRRPFVSLADDLADRDLEPATAEELLAVEPETQQRLADLFQRVWETAGLANVDAIRQRGIRDNQSWMSGREGDKVGDLPYTDERSMRPVDTPYADANITAAIPDDGLPPGVALPFTDLVSLAHDKLGEEDGLIDFLLNRGERVAEMVRPPYGRFSDLQPEVRSDQAPSSGFRDPRLARDLAHDMRMPPYMRDEMATALGLMRRQYEELMAYVRAVARPAADGLADVAPADTGDRLPVRRRVRRRLDEARKAPHPQPPADGSPALAEPTT